MLDGLFACRPRHADVYDMTFLFSVQCVVEGADRDRVYGLEVAIYPHCNYCRGVVLMPSYV